MKKLIFTIFYFILGCISTFASLEDDMVDTTNPSNIYEGDLGS
jgi:hypothetical protein